MEPHNLTDNSDFFSATQWDQFYPQEDYKKRGAYALNFLIARNQKNDAIVTYINKLNETNPVKFTLADPQNSNWTPLHIAAMKSNEAVAEKLLSMCSDVSKKKMMIHAKDAKGWTALHFAALTSDSLFQCFLKHGANIKLKVNIGLDCNELHILSGRATDIRSKSTLYIEDPDSRTLTLKENASEAIKEKIFGKNFFFTDSPLFTPDCYHKMWTGEEKHSDQMQAFSYAPLYEISKLHPPKLIICQHVDLSKIIEHCFELKAKDKISKNQYITEYSGKKEKMRFPNSFPKYFLKEEIAQGEYTLEDINARDAGNDARFANCGFPNAQAISFDVNGIERTCLFSISDINPGEPILWDYGINMLNLTLGTQILLGKENMITFVKKHGKKLFENLKKSQKNIEANFTSIKKSPSIILDFFSDKAKMIYIINSPTALLYLHFNGIVDYSFWSKEFLDGTAYSEWKQGFASAAYYIRLIFNTLDKLDILIKNNPDAKEQVHEWICQKLEKVPLIHILKGIDLFLEKFNTNDSKELLCLNEIDQFLATYEWQNDPDFPFCLEKIADISLLLNNYPKDVLLEALQDNLKGLNPEEDSYRVCKLMIEKLLK